jgi:hypothetical protein
LWTLVHAGAAGRGERCLGRVVGEMRTFLTVVVPAKAGTHNHSRSKGYNPRAPSRRHGVWVPAFAGTTIERESHPTVLRLLL